MDKKCGLHVNAHKTEYACYKQTGDISAQDETSLKLGSSVSSTEKDIDTRLTKAWTAIDRLSIICLQSRKLYKLDEPDTQDTARETSANSSVIYSYRPPHMAEQTRTTSSNIHTAAM